MLGLLIDAAVLMTLIKSVAGQDVDFITGVAIAFVVSIVAGLVTVGLSTLMGVVGLVLAAVLTAVLVGFAVSVMLGTEFKRACLIGVIFLLVHIGVELSFGAMSAVIGV